jgi:hypothetical protein
VEIEVPPVCDSFLPSTSTTASSRVRSDGKNESHTGGTSISTTGSHCGLEGSVLHAMIGKELGLPVVEIEVPPVCDSFLPALRTRLEAVVEVVRQRRGR